MCSAAADHGGATSITAIHPHVIQSHILDKLDAQTLTSVACASTQFHILSSSDHLWRQISNSTWPSTAHPAVRAAIDAFPSGHRSFYADAFLSAHELKEPPPARAHDVPELLISAVDIYADGKAIYSKVLLTSTTSPWFLSLPFRLSLLNPKESIPTPLEYSGGGDECVVRAKDRVTVSWIIIDHSRNRAINAVTVKAVEAQRHLITRDIHLRYATMLSGGGGEDPVECGVAVTCGGKEGRELQVREVSMQMEDVEGRVLTGKGSLVILQGVMEGQKRKRSWELEEEMYEKFSRMKMQIRERRVRWERNLDMLFMAIAFGLSLFLPTIIRYLSHRPTK